MLLDEVDSVLIGELGLLADALEKGHAKTYFFKRICWHPSESTRIVRVAFKADESVSSIRLCVSSDNNNSVFVQAPLERKALKARVADEIALFQRVRLKPLIDPGPSNTLMDAKASLSVATVCVPH